MLNLSRGSGGMLLHKKKELYVHFRAFLGVTVYVISHTHIIHAEVEYNNNAVINYQQL